jgi:hypothetical protein
MAYKRFRWRLHFVKEPVFVVYKTEIYRRKGNRDRMGVSAADGVGEKRLELFNFKGLREKRDLGRFEEFHGRRADRVAGDENDAFEHRRLKTADFLVEPLSVHGRHEKIGKDDVVPGFANFYERDLAARHPVHVVAEMADDALDDVSHDLLVVHREHAAPAMGRPRGHRPSAPRSGGAPVKPCGPDHEARLPRVPDAGAGRNDGWW